MFANRTALLGTLAAFSLAAFSHTAIAASAKSKAKLKKPKAQYEMSVQKRRSQGFLKSNQGVAKARQCTWTNDNIAECSETIGDTIVFTCFDHYGNSIGC